MLEEIRKQREVLKHVQGYHTVDGAGVHLVRVLGHQTMHEFDPILMLDSFDSTNPTDYVAGFPMHPHRGIETISYIYRGKMTHRDSLGNEDTIANQELQWMTAGSGILHEERLPATERMLGVQLWLNMPALHKMAVPNYRAIKKDEILRITEGDTEVYLLAGNYKGYQGYQGNYQPFDYYDIHGKKDSMFCLETPSKRSLMLFTLLGSIEINGEIIPEKTAVKLSEGEFAEYKVVSDMAQVLWISSEKLSEPIAWGGPIVMNTKEELQQAFDDLDEGTFLRQSIRYEE